MNGVEYFPELLDLDKVKLESKYGIFSVGLTKNSKVITGYQWNYKYWDGETVRLIHSYDLRLLRERVLSKGLDWIITDNRKAIDSYKLNNKFMEIHKNHIREYGERMYYGSTGVKYVSKYNNSKYRKGYHWVYSNREGVCFTCKSLDCLKSKVISRGLDWIVKDEELYLETLKMDKLEDV